MPWGGEMVVQVMVLWVTAFWLLGCFVVPIALDLAGLEREDLSSRGQVSPYTLYPVSTPRPASPCPGPELCPASRVGPAAAAVHLPAGGAPWQLLQGCRFLCVRGAEPGAAHAPAVPGSGGGGGCCAAESLRQPAILRWGWAQDLLESPTSLRLEAAAAVARRGTCCGLT